MFSSRIKRAVSGLALVVVTATAARADVITAWNNEWLETIRVVGGPPCPLARNQAILFVAMYDAVNSIHQEYEPYVALQNVTSPASERAAAAAAAHHVMTTLYPARAAIYDDRYQHQIADVRNVAARDNGIAVGIAAAQAILDLRANDRTDVNTNYQMQDVPGSWRPTPPDFTFPPFNPGWGTTACWTIPTGDFLRPGGPFGYADLPTLLRSRGYADQFKEVKAKGALKSKKRTVEETQIAWFWANDRNGTYKPPGHLMDITANVSNQEGLTLYENARLFALVGLALADAGAVAWDQKYSSDLWRPVTAIRLANTDGNNKTERQNKWLPLLDFTPPFPAYTSGHATFGAAHAAIMRNYFGTDEMTFTISTDEPAVRNVTRTFTSFSAAGRENGLSRVYLGVHFRFDADIGYATGTALGNYVSENYLLPVGSSHAPNVTGITRTLSPAMFLGALGASDPSADLNDDNNVDDEDLFLFMSDLTSPLRLQGN